MGRDAELAATLRGLESPPALVVVEGEPGIGKTRLVLEALSSPCMSNSPVLMAVCPPVDEPLPLGPVVDGLRRLAPRLKCLELSPLTGALRPLFPEWDDILPPAPEPMDDRGEVRQRLFSALTELVVCAGVDCLVVEDAHWADAATLEWLLTMIPAVIADPMRPMSIVVTYRPTDVPDESLLRRLTSRPSASMRRVRLELTPLDLATTRHLVGSMLSGSTVPEQFVRFLHEHTDGIPLALEETVRVLGERGDVRLEDGGAWSSQTLDALKVPAARPGVGRPIARARSCRREVRSWTSAYWRRTRRGSGIVGSILSNGGLATIGSGRGSTD